MLVVLPCCWLPFLSQRWVHPCDASARWLRCRCVTSLSDASEPMKSRYHFTFFHLLIFLCWTPSKCFQGALIHPSPSRPSCRICAHWRPSVQFTCFQEKAKPKPHWNVMQNASKCNLCLHRFMVYKSKTSFDFVYLSPPTIKMTYISQQHRPPWQRSGTTAW